MIGYPTEHERFLQAILERPDDDAPRLMYADYLSERGDVRGEFIRVQVELSGMGRPQYASLLKATSYDHALDDCCEVDREILLRRREQELLNTHGQDFLVPFAKALGVSDEPGLHPDNRYRFIGTKQLALDDTGRRSLGITFRRGFVDEIHLTTEDFLAHAKALFAQQPITKVRLTDRETSSVAPSPVHPTIRCLWYVMAGDWHQRLPGEKSWLPRDLAPLRRGGHVFFDSPDIAYAWLYDRCVDVGREWAGLPPLVRKEQSR